MSGSASSSTEGVVPPHPPKLQHHASSNMEHVQRFGPHSNMVFHDEFGERPPARRIRELIGKPVIRQWIQGGKLYREPSAREVPRFELFFDLLFVGIIHQLAESAIEEPGGIAVARFILTFYPSWSIWEEARRYSNQSGTDDLVHRVWVLAGMICSMGYSANASAIELHPSEEGEEGVVHDHTAVRAAVAFWLIIKLSRALVLWFYAWKLPKFRTSQFLGGCAVFLPMFVYLPLIWVTSRRAQIIIATVGICVDLCRIDAVFMYIGGRYLRWRTRREEERRIQAGEMRPEDRSNPTSMLAMVQFKDGFRIPAINIEHSIERSGAFVVIVLGELVMNLLYTATKGEFGASPMFGKAALGLLVAWALNYLYMTPVEGPYPYEHAVRRSWFTGMMWSFLHWPLCASLVLASSASGEMVKHDEVEAGVKWYWGCGLGFSVLFMAIIDVLHKHMHPWRAERVPRDSWRRRTNTNILYKSGSTDLQAVRFTIAVGGALALMLFPLSAHRLSSTAMMGISVAITWFILIVNVLGQLPTNCDDPEVINTQSAPEPVVTQLNRQETNTTGHRNVFTAVDDEFNVMSHT
ncbi:uncharacterized protein EHS24_000968 [Apiotrichum porosum]|uniref:Uncharacterized protein n=1 Tax=Apiotrichum porosum TaxID=105984 RepID=A0A427YBF5_9TREE|nr:uncharacterized protein EHS24_000968 [Apiotrichum porosum]RSH88423.1 hypothetical protein EHS24_000968 [Apiotrichum porosum]